MTRDEAMALHAELAALVAHGPGGINDDARRQLRRIRFAFGTARETDTYLREKVGDACEYLEIWLSPRRWQRWGHDPDKFRAIVSSAVYKVRMAIDTAFPDNSRCRFRQEIPTRDHTEQLDEDAVCTSCGAILARIRSRIAAGAMFPSETSGALDDRIAVEPTPQNALADCAACGERFNALTNQRAYLATDRRWRFVHEASCWTLLHSGLAP